MAQVHAGKLDNSSMIPVCAVQTTTLRKNAMYPCCEDITSTIGNHAGDNNLVPLKIDIKSHEPLDISGFSSKAVKESAQLEGFSRPTSVIKNSSSVPPEVSSSVRVKVEMEICDDAIVAQKDTRSGTLYE